MNEATLEAAAHGVVARLFPTITPVRLTHQTSFTLRFGHHKIKVGDSAVANEEKKPKAYYLGRLDALVSIDGKPCLLLELKAPGTDLTDDDRDQALSYARLLTPMPPLFAVSNGTDTSIFHTYDVRPWQAQTVDDAAFGMLLRNAMSLAASDKDAAIRHLLGKNPELWRPIFLEETTRALAELEGDPDDFTRPLITRSSVPRVVVKELQSRIGSPSQVVVLTGPPLSGKTNVLAQFCRQASDAIVPLYIDVSSAQYGPLRHIANILTKSVFAATSTDQVRQWLLTGLGGGEGVRLVLVIDGWSHGTGNKIARDVDELLTMTGGRCLSLLLALESEFFLTLQKTQGGPSKTRLGRLSAAVELLPLCDDEYEAALALLFERRGALPYSGAKCNAEYREPRQFRVLMATLPPPEPDDAEGPTGTFFPSITGPADLERTWDRFVIDPEMANLFEKLALAFINERSHRQGNPALLMARTGNPIITIDAATRTLGHGGVLRLRNLGHISMIHTRSSGLLVLAKIREIFSAAAANVITRRIRSTDDYDVAYQQLIRDTEDLPLGDVVGANVVVQLGKADDRYLWKMLKRLLEDEPTESRLQAGARVALLTPRGPIGVEFGEGMDERVTGNTHPWLILSHVAAYPMETAGEEESPNAWIFARVGAYSHTLRRQDTILSRPTTGFHVHEVKERGTVLCHTNGIIEPVTQSMLLAFDSRPEEMVELASYAVDQGQFHLANRLIAAAGIVASRTDEEIASAGRAAFTVLREYLEAALGSDAHVPESPGSPD